MIQQIQIVSGCAMRVVAGPVALTDLAVLDRLLFDELGAASKDVNEPWMSGGRVFDESLQDFLFSAQRCCHLIAACRCIT